MKKILIIFLMFTSVFAPAQSSSKAENLLNQVYEKVKSYRNITLEFDYMLDNDKENIHQETQGKVSMEGEKYHLNFSGTERIFDGKQIYTIDHEDEEVVISKPDPDEESEFTPSKILTFYKNGYKLVWGDEKNINGKKIRFIKLIPIRKNNDNRYIQLGIDMLNKFIYQVIYTAQNGTLTTFRIRSYKTDKVLPEKEFTFDEAKYKSKNYIITRI